MFDGWMEDLFKVAGDIVECRFQSKTDRRMLKDIYIYKKNLTWYPRINHLDNLSSRLTARKNCCMCAGSVSTINL